MRRSRRFVTDRAITAIIVAMVVIIAMFAISSYYRYFLGTRIAQGTSKLAGMRLNMERYFQKNFTYNNPQSPPCEAAESSVAPLPTDSNFTYSCPVLTATQFTVVATGNDSMAGFEYSIDQNDNRVTVSVPTGWQGAGARCWVIKRDGSCGR
jgi:type IV pilus assembly protein PilE